MKKFSKTLFIITILILLVGCDNNYIPKTEFGINEEAEADSIKISLTSAKIIENDVLEVVFSIKNNRKNTITIDPDTYFRLYDINKVQISNHYEGNNSIIKSGEKVMYTLQYVVSKKDIYEIYFYSGIVENNIKFTITTSDLN